MSRKRTKAYVDAQKIIHDQALWIPLVYPTAAALTRANVSGYNVSPFGRQNFGARCRCSKHRRCQAGVKRITPSSPV